MCSDFFSNGGGGNSEDHAGFFNTTSTRAMIVSNTGTFKCFCSNPWILFFAFLLELSVLKIYCSLSIEVLALPKNKM